jgi:hypothetical protein
MHTKNTYHIENRGIKNKQLFIEILSTNNNRNTKQSKALMTLKTPLTGRSMAVFVHI